jgi:hypothetical protein
MRRRTTAVYVVAVVVMSATMLAGCANKPTDPAVSATADAPTQALAGQAPGATAPLPTPEALTGVLDKLADTSVPGAQKVSLVEGATADEGAKLDQFGKALNDSGYAPLDFAATDIAWSGTVPGNVAAKVTVHSQNPALASGFTLPMEFRPYLGSWQLSSKTADMLLALGGAPTPTS